MSKTEMIDKLFNEIDQLHNQIDQINTNYISIILGMLGVIAAFIGFQWYLNKKQADEIKRKTEKDLTEKYNLAKVNDRLDELEQKNDNLSKDFMETTTNNINIELIYLSTLKNEDPEFIRPIQQNIGNNINSVMFCGASRNTINKYLHIIIDQIAKASDQITGDPQEVVPMQEWFRALRRNIIFGTIWDENYKAPEQDGNRDNSDKYPNSTIDSAE